MGIEVELETTLPPVGLVSIFKRKIDWEKELFEVLKETLNGHGLSALIPAIAERPNGRLPLHYCEEWADVLVVNGKLTVAARTSTCGPGYHAAFCAGVDAFAEKFQLKFQATSSTGDETGYFVSRDFKALQKYFSVWLKSLGSILDRDTGNQQSFRLQLAIEQLAPDGNPDEVLTPLGPKRKLYVKSFAGLSDTQMTGVAKNWFPWWEQEPASADFVKMAERIMWTDLPWHVPENAYEKHLYSAAISAVQKARAFGVDVSRLDAEYNEMLMLNDALVDQYTAPSEKGIGYRRQNCRWVLTPSWTGLLPGYLFEIFSEDNYQMHFDNFVIRLTSFSVSGDSDDFVMPPERDENEIVATGKTDQFAWRIEDMKSSDKNDWITSFVYAASKTSVLVATFSYQNTFDPSRLIKFADGLACAKNTANP